MSRMSRTGGRDVLVAMRDCGICTTSQTRPVCKHRLSALQWSIKRRQRKHKFDYHGVVFAPIATGCGLMRKTRRGWIQIGESRTRGVARIPLGLKPSRPSRAISQRDSPIWNQPLGVFRYRIHAWTMGMNIKLFGVKISSCFIPLSDKTLFHLIYDFCANTGTSSVLQYSQDISFWSSRQIMSND